MNKRKWFHTNKQTCPTLTQSKKQAKTRSKHLPTSSNKNPPIITIQKHQNQTCIQTKIMINKHAYHNKTNNHPGLTCCQAYRPQRLTLVVQLRQHPPQNQWRQASICLHQKHHRPNDPNKGPFTHVGNKNNKTKPKFTTLVSKRLNPVLPPPMPLHNSHQPDHHHHWPNQPATYPSRQMNLPFYLGIHICNKEFTTTSSTRYQHHIERSIKQHIWRHPPAIPQHHQYGSNKQWALTYQLT